MNTFCRSGYVGSAVFDRAESAHIGNSNHEQRCHGVGLHTAHVVRIQDQRPICVGSATVQTTISRMKIADQDDWVSFLEATA